jgi:protein O-GlcNAc transferase
MYHGIDIALDVSPYNGTTTTCEALWMGVPVLTLRGASHAARVGTSILSHAGLTELVASRTEEYLDAAIELARDPARLQALRASMRSRLRASPLLDAAGFTRGLEAAYRSAWRQWCSCD